MKKFLTILLALCMVATMSVTAFAAENDKKTDVTYDASTNGGKASAEWTVTVPASLTTGGAEGEVKVEGYWAPSSLLTVSTDETVTMYLGGEATADYAVVPVDFAGISKAGSYTESVDETEMVSVDDENAMGDIKFGIWKGTVVFNVALVNNPNYTSGNNIGGTTAPEEPIPEGAVMIATADELVAFVNSANDGARAVLTADIEVTESILITSSITLDLGTYTITGDLDDAILRVYAPDENTQINVVIDATTGGVTNAGTGYAIYSGEDIAAGDDTERTNLTINGGTYMTNGTDCVRQIIGTCTINGGSYKSSFGRTVLNGQRWYGSEFVINDGSFYGFNPACVSVWTGFDGSDYTNFYHQHDIIASGKTVEYSNGWYTVVDGTFAPKASTKSLCFISVSVAMQEIVEMNDVANLGTITLLANDTLTEADTELAINNQFSFVLGGYTLTLPTGYTTYETVIDGNTTVTKIVSVVE